MRVFYLRGRLLYRDAGRRPHPPGAKGRVDLRQVRNMEAAVQAARDEGLISVADGREELATLRSMRKALVESDERQAPCIFVSADQEMRVRARADQTARKRRQAERAARKLGRKPKKKRRRKH